MKEKHLQMFPQLVYELVINSERYDQILGYRQPDGCRVKGLYDGFTGSKVSGNRRFLFCGKAMVS